MTEDKVRDAVRITDELIDINRMSQLPEDQGLQLWQTVFGALVNKPHTNAATPSSRERLLSVVGGDDGLVELKQSNPILANYLAALFNVEITP